MEIVTNYAKDHELRDSLNQFSQDIFGISVLKEDDVHYVPFSWVKDGKVIANVSVGTFHQIINGKKQIAHMIQTVGTLPEYRKQGLIRGLFEQVDQYIAEQGGKSFFWASQQMVEFYRQFGYRASDLVGHFEELPPSIDAFRPDSVERVDLKDPEARGKLAQALGQRTPVSNVYGDIELGWLFLWYCDQVFGEDVYYIPQLGVYVVYKLEGQDLVLFDVVGKSLPNISELFSYIGDPSIEKIKYIFTPDLIGQAPTAHPDDENMFFTRGSFESPDSEFTIPMMARG